MGPRMRAEVKLDGGRRGTGPGSQDVGTRQPWSRTGDCAVSQEGPGPVFWLRKLGSQQPGLEFFHQPPLAMGLQEATDPFYTCEKEKKIECKSLL